MQKPKYQLPFLDYVASGIFGEGKEVTGNKEVVLYIIN
jgi:hypothetical protein